MTDAESQEWQERLRRAVEQTLRRRAARAEIRRELAHLRQHGLQARHANKLNRPGDTAEKP
jgi:hypothetical protein